jgi:hypothetical protein
LPCGFKGKKAKLPVPCPKPFDYNRTQTFFNLDLHEEPLASVEGRNSGKRFSMVNRETAVRGTPGRGLNVFWLRAGDAVALTRGLFTI